MTTDFYNENASGFFDDTINADLSDIYQNFLPLLKSNAHILDAGCGSGRDAAFFSQKNYSVTAFDASEALVLKAREHTGLAISLNTFENFQREPTTPLFDAIWACASLLHVPSDKIAASFSNLATQLQQNGIFYCSFKLGTEDTHRNGRYFTNADAARLASFIENTPLVIEKIWITDDVRPDRQDEKWLNAILRKV
ncbi:class I SAM-dependent methyltransferase [Colwellia sp. E2M01]|uniref:class I SAM-dependent methyltransferase n=1 Tax=Colwellia sp. E2M01 TaxID=2841561 RepID=UPI001C0848A7|nr:class I SAM-dependent methyltransferase [Colwellia sp. E2M01]MBU2871113.1 class I SAM-dependent methyltransferase [Colwellia sp. E2M01]